jgi:hypothetical protein
MGKPLRSRPPQDCVDLTAYAECHKILSRLPDHTAAADLTKDLERLNKLPMPLFTYFAEGLVCGLDGMTQLPIWTDATEALSELAMSLDNTSTLLALRPHFLAAPHLCRRLLTHMAGYPSVASVAQELVCVRDSRGHQVFRPEARALCEALAADDEVLYSLLDALEDTYYVGSTLYAIISVSDRVTSLLLRNGLLPMVIDNNNLEADEQIILLDALTRSETGARLCADMSLGVKIVAWLQHGAYAEGMRVLRRLVHCGTPLESLLRSADTLAHTFTRVLTAPARKRQGAEAARLLLDLMRTEPAAATAVVVKAAGLVAALRKCAAGEGEWEDEERAAARECLQLLPT